MDLSFEHFTYAQALGLVAMVVTVFAYTMKTERKLNQAFIVSNIIWVIHFMWIGGTVGAVNRIINILRSSLSLVLPDKKWNKIGFAAMVILYCAVTFYTYKAPSDLLPLAGSLFLCYAFYLAKPGLQSRFFVLCQSLCWLAYSVFVHSIGGTITFFLSAIMTLFVLYRLANAPASHRS